MAAKTAIRHPAPAPAPETIPMSTATVIAPSGNGNGTLAIDNSDDIFNEIASSGKFLARLQMFGSKSGPIAEGKLTGPACYAIVTGKDKYQDLGDSVDCLPITWRPKAMDLNADDNVIALYNPQDPEFKRIVTDSEEQDSGCMFGPEFLVWLPTIKRFAGLFMSTKTARRQAPELRKRLGMPTTLRIEFITTKKYKWHGIEVQACSTPFEMPEPDALTAESTKFLNPPQAEVERAEPTTARVR